MARRPRIEFEGAFYHVITRGNQRQPFFKERKDNEQYLNVVWDYKVHYDFSLYAYKDLGLYPWSGNGYYVGRIRDKGMVEACEAVWIQGEGDRGMSPPGPSGYYSILKEGEEI